MAPGDAHRLALGDDGGERQRRPGLKSHLPWHVALARRDDAEAEQRFATSMALYEELGDRRQLGGVLDGMSHLALYRQRLQDAERLAREGLALHREIGLRDRIADSLTTLSWIALAAGRPDDARAIYDEAHALWSDLGIEERINLPAGLEDQPFTPLWFREIIDQRLDRATRAGSGSADSL